MIVTINAQRFILLLTVVTSFLIRAKNMLIIAFKAVSDIAFNALWVVSFTMQQITVTIKKLRCVIPGIAFADLSINTVAVSASLRTVRHITNYASPARITLADVRFNRKSMNAGRITYWLVATWTLIPVKTFTDIWSRANSIFTVFANSYTTDWALPTFIALACVRINAFSHDARWRAHRCIAVKSSPSNFAFAALTLILHILFKASVKVC